MSQSSFLDHVAGWSQEKCKENLDEALPKLVGQIVKSQKHDLVSLKLLCDLFVPVCPPQRVENDIFRLICKKVISWSDEIYGELCSTINQTSLVMDQVKNCLCGLLEASMDLVGCMDSCVASLKQAEGLTTGAIHSLSPIVLCMIANSYNHCKDSGNIYGEMLGALTEQLSALFKKTHALQMNFIGLVDTLSVCSSEEDIEDLCTVLQGFHNISMVAVSLDVKVMIVMWKAISRLASQHRQLLYGRLDLDPMLSSLVADMTSSFNYLSQMVTDSNQTDNKAFSKSVKVLGFQMKVLVSLVKEYGEGLHGCIDGIIKMLFIIQGSLPPSVAALRMSKAHRDEIQGVIAAALEPLVSYLIPHKRFIQALTVRNRDPDFNHWLPLCMTLSNVLTMLPNYPDEIQSQWMLNPDDKDRDTVLKAVFAVIPKCYVELSLPASLPGVMCQGKPRRTVSLYEHLCTGLCGFAACCPKQHFACLESCLIENVLSCNLHNAMLAADVWCFVVRYGTAALCQDHCIFLAKLLTTSGWAPTSPCCHLVMTLRRLVKFLAPEHQEGFLQTFPVENHLPLYTVLPVSMFPSQAANTQGHKVMTLCDQCLNLWLSNSVKTAAQALKLAQLLSIMSNLLSSGFSDDFIPNDLQMTLMAKMCQLTLTLTSVTFKQGSVIQTLAAAVVDTMAFMSNLMDNSTLLKILDIFFSWLAVPDLQNNVKLSIISFMQSLGKKTFPVDNQQPQILNKLPRLFNVLLSDNNVVVHQMGLECFAQFAEETVHETIVPDSLQTDEKTQTAVVSYLNKLSNGGQSVASDTDFLRLQQDVLQKSLTLSPSQIFSKPAPSVKKSADENEPQCKRQKINPVASQDLGAFHEAIALIKQGTTALSSLHSANKVIPVSVLREISQIQQQLTIVMKPS